MREKHKKRRKARLSISEWLDVFDYKLIREALRFDKKRRKHVREYVS